MNFDFNYSKGTPKLERVAFKVAEIICYLIFIALLVFSVIMFSKFLMWVIF